MATEIARFALETFDAQMSVVHLAHPYQGSSVDVVSIGVTLHPGSAPEWKVHIPYANLDALIAALNEAKARYGN